MTDSDQKSPEMCESTTYKLRLQYAIPTEVMANVPIDQGTVKTRWMREFTALGRHTLEQLNEIILYILGWELDHLYEFHIAGRVHAHLVFLGEDDLIVDTDQPCVSCDISIRLLGLRVGDTFTYIYDFGDYHVFRITVCDIRQTSTDEVVPALLSHRGKNILQYPDTTRNADELAFMEKAPTATAPMSIRERFRVRFIRSADSSALHEWRKSNDKKNWQKAVAILESRNMPVSSIATKIERSEKNVQNWIAAFNHFGLDGLKKPSLRNDIGTPRKPSKRTVASEQKAKRVLEIVHAQPKSYGINRSNWTVDSIACAYEQKYQETVSRGTVSRALKRFGYAIRKARKVLTSPDPNYREKVDLLLNTLQNLGPKDLLFFIDELGPLRVKKYGGRALVRKEDFITYPQKQAHRGVIMMSGALSATTNQVTWIYARSKDSGAMIDLIEVLYNQHFSALKLYVTWDAASWHKSTLLVEWLDAFNAITKTTGEGPLIELVPLPTSSQFLDVIEAVFSGMKRAVIHHSDYANVLEMKKAISQHFNDRNTHFCENPRRAGKKIWEIDFFNDNENIRSANYREW